jgi:hypothetical protein
MPSPPPGTKTPKTVKPWAAEDPYSKTGNSSKNTFSDVKYGAPIAAAIGGQVGRFVAGPTAPITQYWEVMAAGLLAGVLVNYMAVTSDGDNFAYKNPYHKFPTKMPGKAGFFGIKGSEATCYVRRGDEKGYWVNAVCYGQAANTAIMFGYDTIAQFVVAALVLVIRHGGLKNNLREILGLLAGVGIGSEGYARYVNADYKNTLTFNPADGMFNAEKLDGQTSWYGQNYDGTTAITDYTQNAYLFKQKDGSYKA